MSKLKTLSWHQGPSSRARRYLELGRSISNQCSTWMVVNQSFRYEIGLDDTHRQLKSTINSDAADLSCTWWLLSMEGHHYSPDAQRSKDLDFEVITALSSVLRPLRYSQHSHAPTTVTHSAHHPASCLGSSAASSKKLLTPSLLS